MTWQSPSMPGDCFTEFTLSEATARSDSFLRGVGDRPGDEDPFLVRLARFFVTPVLDKSFQHLRFSE